ncbi:KR domain-containing protein [Providencia rettgeri]|nr:KR domain-containing protein [Providencia rettgeri]ELR5072512.1 KR domain-containing protein [Providencia stuartii]ELR5221008.1 KR domain-containing protein [Providencia rettgeri]MBV2191159.1 KR domain-containing protein [Providencia rettgeri]
MAKQLVHEGCRRIILAGRDAQKGEKAVEELHALDCETLFISIDLQCADECLALVDIYVK